MSYSFSFKAASKEAAKAQAAEQFDKQVMASQPVHARDRDAALANACAMIDLCVEPGEGEEIAVYMHGSLGMRGWDPQTGYDNAVVTSANANASVNVTTRSA